MINIVYRYLHVDRIEPGTSARLPEPYLWSRTEHAEADAVVYVNEYSYLAARARAAGPKPRILFIAEPVVVHPPQYHRRCWRRFDAIISCNPLLARESPRFHRLPVIIYGWPFPSGHGFTGSPCDEDQLLSRRHAICQVVGAKHSLLSPQLYTLRRDVALWFHRNGSLPMDVYGRPPMTVPNYRGGTDDKLATMRQYRFALCFENSYHPRWTCGYLTEKLLDSMQADTVPIYLGCANVEDYVPADCFIDYRSLGSPAKLDTFLQGLSADDYLGYVRRIRAFLASYKPEEHHHCRRLYRLISELVDTCQARDARDDRSRDEWPEDFLQSGASFRDRLAFHVSCGIVRHPGAVRGLMRGAGWIQRWGDRGRGEAPAQDNAGASRDG